ncbi:hypothetical protein BJV82DRAFT_666102 [Fennellomyces sp. T-0311]|nr:hypothetical protein BJV82DRAFT_666102 [Fennellomyces sp. T-0311]
MSGDDLSSVQPTPPKSSTRLVASQPNQMIAMHNPIQLAAISNYKLAQLTFAAPDLHSMRKTALIKNMLDVLYDDTPPEWLDQMTRWSFFTPESLGDMTQETLEEMFAQYAQTIEAFQPLDIDEDDDDDDGDDHEMWLSDHDEYDEHINTSGSSMSEPSIFSQPHATISSDSISRPVPPTPSLPPSPAASLVEKPLPKNPPEDIPSARRKSLTPSLRKSRLSWTSDTGVLPTGSVVVQNMASELMNLFDMEFSVDINLNTAPKLPELPFPKNDTRQSQRYSIDSLMGLIPTFEAFTLDDDPYFQAAQTPGRSRLSQSWSHQMTFPPPPSAPPPFNERRSSKRRSSSFPPLSEIPKPPQRSSSLKYREQRQVAMASAEELGGGSSGGIKSKSSEFLATFTNALRHDKPDTSGTDSLPKKKSIHKLASFVRGNKKRASSKKNVNEVDSYHSTPTLPLSNDSLAVPQQDEPRKSISSTLSSSSSWSSTSEVMVVRKASLMRRPQRNEDDNAVKRRSYTVARPVVVEAQDLRRARSLGHNRYPKHRSKRRSSLLMEKTASKQASIQQGSKSADDLKRKSTFIKIGSGFKSRKRQQRRSKEIRRRSTLPPVKLIDTVIEEEQQQQQQPDTHGGNTFVKRMATLGRRMRLQRT